MIPTLQLCLRNFFFKPMKCLAVLTTVTIKEKQKAGHLPSTATFQRPLGVLRFNQAPVDPMAGHLSGPPGTSRSSSNLQLLWPGSGLQLLHLLLLHEASFAVF